MKQYLLTAVGLALLVLGAVKGTGLAHQLLTGADMPDGLVAKQAVYAVTFLGVGVGAIRAARDRPARE